MIRRMKLLLSYTVFMPGRQYDIDLALVRGGQVSLRRQVVTEGTFVVYCIILVLY